MKRSAYEAKVNKVTPHLSFIKTIATKLITIKINN